MLLLILVLGISGSYLALLLTGMALNVGSYTGLIMIIGIIGENLIFTFLQFKESLHEKNVDDAITFAISTRLRHNTLGIHEIAIVDQFDKGYTTNGKTGTCTVFDLKL